MLRTYAYPEKKGVYQGRWHQWFYAAQVGICHHRLNKVFTLAAALLRSGFEYPGHVHDQSRCLKHLLQQVATLIPKEYTSCLQAVHKQWCELREKIIQLQQEHDDEEAELKLLLETSAQDR